MSRKPRCEVADPVACRFFTPCRDASGVHSYVAMIGSPASRLSTGEVGFVVDWGFSQVFSRSTA